MRHVSWCLALLACVSSQGSTQAVGINDPTASKASAELRNASPIGNVAGRQTVSVDGVWEIIVDPLSIGDRSPITQQPGGAGFGLDRRASSPSELLEYKFVPEVALKVPGDWNSQDLRLFFYEGAVWYRKTFARPTGQRVFINFGAANFAADVFVNGKIAGHHEGGFTPFAVEATPYLKDGDNVVIAKVDNRLTLSTVPTRNNDWLNFGGITRHVALISTPSKFLRSTYVRLVDRDRRLIRADVELDGAVAGDKVRIDLPELRRSAVVTVDASGRGQGEFTAPVELWQPSRPKRYLVRFIAGADVTQDKIGFRTIESRGRQLLLNGKPLFLKGIAMQDESLLHPGRSSSEADARATLDLVQALGCNYLRLGQFPGDEALVRLADERGILLWEEVPVYWTMDWTNSATRSSAKRQMREIFNRDANRASLIIWSIGNETPDGPDRLAFMRDLAQTTRTLDPQRLISAALLGDPGRTYRPYTIFIAARLALDPTTPRASAERLRNWIATSLKRPIDGAALKALAKSAKLTIDDQLADSLDVISLNEYLGWYTSAPFSKLLPADESSIRRMELASLPDVTVKTTVAKPILISEFGADALAGFIGDESTVTSERFQAHFISQQLRMLANSEGVVGISPWVLRDFRTPLRTHPEYEQYWNRKGLVDGSGRRKAAFETLRLFYARMGNSPRLPRP